MSASSRSLLLALFFVLGAACTGASEDPAPAEAAEGPPEVQIEAVEEHAAQFDEDLPERPAGSQQEFAAATYITGHLQQAGYEVRLASVPYKDLVRSTNVVALPPGGEPIEAVVTVLYDTASNMEPNGRDLGLFLEIARALRVAEPDHQVQFVALAAEVTNQSGGNLGSKTLAGELADLDEKPPVIALLEVSGGGFEALGAGADELTQIAAEMDIPISRPSTGPPPPAYLRATEIFLAADVPHTVAAGGIDDLGRVLLGYLSGR